MTPTITGGIICLVTETMSVTVACAECCKQPYNEDLGYVPAFDSAEQAIEQLTDGEGYGWMVVTRPDQTRELVCEECGCAHLGHQPRENGPYRAPDGTLIGAYTSCDRCGEILASEPDIPAPAGYPVSEKFGTGHWLQWDPAALPDGGDIARAARRLLDRLNDTANAARWDAFDGPQDGRPRPAAEPDPEQDAAAARILIRAAQQLLPVPARQEAIR